MSKAEAANNALPKDPSLEGTADGLLEESDNLRQALVDQYPNCLPAAPQARATAIVVRGGPEVILSGSGSTGEGLTFEWIAGDINHADGIYGRRVAVQYLIPGLYVPQLHVEDVYGRYSTVNAKEIRVVD